MCDCAEQQGLRVDRNVVQQAALLHDIGRSITQDIRHASVGAELLRTASWPSSVVDAVERHTGAGIDAREAAALGLPVKDYTPQTLEQQIVAHADNLYSGDKRLTLGAVRDKYLAKGLTQAWQKISLLHAHLAAKLGADLEQLVPVHLPEP